MVGPRPGLTVLVKRKVTVTERTKIQLFTLELVTLLTELYWFILSCTTNFIEQVLPSEAYGSSTSYKI
jgi:hypothetical protein